MRIEKRTEAILEIEITLETDTREKRIDCISLTVILIEFLQSISTEELQQSGSHCLGEKPN